MNDLNPASVTEGEAMAIDNITMMKRQFLNDNINKNRNIIYYKTIIIQDASSISGRRIAQSSI